MRLGDLDALQKEFEELARIVAYCDRERERDAAVRVKCAPTIDPETLPIVKELRAENKKLTEALEDSFAFDLMNKLDKVEKERDAAIEDLRDCAVEDYAECIYCSHRNKDASLCQDCIYGSNWEWRGVVKKE